MSAPRPVALVTGAQRGIGAAIALALARQGFDIAVADVAGADCDDVVRAAAETGARARAFEFDLADAGGHAGLVDAVVQWGGALCVLVNNAGIGSPQRADLLDVSPEAFDRVLGVNLRGTFFLTQAVARHMLATPGTHARTIVTVSSVSAEMASIERGEYCVSKSGLAMVTRLFALRLAQAGIGVFEVRPGVIRTPMTEAVSARYDERIAGGLVPMGRWGEPEDVAAAVAALAGGRLAFATGSVLQVDGALSLARL
jgi:NAD(P)-dependent dehydrogenase (short-subunit alcohol dehydrogenase family)